MQRCTNCQSVFICTTNDNCWCATYPPVLAPTAATACLCPTCLKLAIQRHTEQYAQEISTGKRPNDLPQTTDPQAPLREGIDFYKENGLYVFKAWYHLKRGNCCGSGCRHCPYQHKNVVV